MPWQRIRLCLQGENSAIQFLAAQFAMLIVVSVKVVGGTLPRAGGGADAQQHQDHADGDAKTCALRLTRTMMTPNHFVAQKQDDVDGQPILLRAHLAKATRSARV